MSGEGAKRDRDGDATGVGAPPPIGGPSGLDVGVAKSIAARGH